MLKALIIGSEGQDGSLLKLLLKEKGYEVWGLGRSQNEKPGENYLQLDLAGDNFEILEKFIIAQRPREIYYVAAFHQSSQENNAAGNFGFIDKSVRVNQTAFMRVMEICRTHHPGARIFYTSSSLIFSGAKQEVQNENTAPEPRCIYSVTKCASMEAAKFYRAAYDLFVSVGIMYNHESKFRNDYFLSKKIINETRELLSGKRDSITVGDLSATTDWGYAPDYAEAMWHTLQLPAADTYILSSGKGHQVKDWFEVLFKHLGKNWKESVKEDPSLIIRKKPVLIGDNSKLRSTGWAPRVSFEEMVIRMYNNVI
jgi:GDPmannose 4,6-dehydratase